MAVKRESDGKFCTLRNSTASLIDVKVNKLDKIALGNGDTLTIHVTQEECFIDLSVRDARRKSDSLTASFFQGVGTGLAVLGIFVIVAIIVRLIVYLFQIAIP